MSLLVEACANNPVQKVAAVPLSWSFLSGLLNHVVKELNVEEVLKLPIFVVRKVAAPKNGVEFRQGSICAVKCSLSMSYKEGDFLAGSFAFKVSEPARMSHRLQIQIS